MSRHPVLPLPSRAARRRPALAALRLLRVPIAPFALALVFAVPLIVATPLTSVFAAPETPIDLGLAASFAILAGDSVGNTVTGPATIARGDLGVVAAAGLVTGFPPGEVRGIRYGSGAPIVVAALADLVDAFAEAGARSSDFALAGDLIGLTLHPGVHTNIGAVANTGTVTLDGDGNPNAVFIFQVGGALAMAAASQVLLTDGTRAQNVFWQVNGAGAVGAGSHFAGTLMTSAAIGVGANSSFNGRALAITGAITTNSDQFYSAPPTMTIAGGLALSVSDDTPTISGTAGIDLPATVTVTMGTQTLTAAVQAGGSWTTTTAIAPNGTYTVEAAVTDGAGNRGSATQQLTIDTVLPVVAIAGGATRLANNSTPTITGTCDVGAGAIVTVAIGSQILTTLVQPAGTWSVTPTLLSDGTRSVVAAVIDEAGNPGSSTQVLTVDTTPPSVLVIGGAVALTNASTPTVNGMSSDPGAAVSLTVSGVTTSATVQLDGTWTATAGSFGDGPHPVVVSITDAAGNIGLASQLLTIDTVAPGISINGGAFASTVGSTPTIAGSTPAAPGSTITVTVVGHISTTLTQPDGSWNVTPTSLALGAHEVRASVSDPAGNVGTAIQILTVTGIGDPGIPTPPQGAATPAVTPIGPKRVVDTRIGQSPSLVRSVATMRVGGSYILDVQFTDLDGYVPAVGVGAVSLNVTAANAHAAGYVTVYPCGAREEVSSLNFTADQAVANAVIAPVSAAGHVCFYASEPTDIIIDINGWLSVGQAYTAAGPKRLFDTRAGSPAALRVVTAAQVPADGMIEVQVTDLAGLVPAAGVDSVSLNVTVTDPEAPGFITVYACGTREAVSSVNYAAGQTVANAVIAPISAHGTVCFYTSAATDLIVDINGWLRAAAGFTGISPKRIFDTRAGSPDAIRSVSKAKVGGGYFLAAHLVGFGSVPRAGVSAVSLNVTATNANAPGYVTVYACGAREEVSSLNFITDRAVANAVIAPVSADGDVCFYASTPTDLIVDVNGWFATTP